MAPFLCLSSMPTNSAREEARDLHHISAVELAWLVLHALEVHSLEFHWLEVHSLEPHSLEVRSREVLCATLNAQGDWVTGLGRRWPSPGNL